MRVPRLKAKLEIFGLLSLCFLLNGCSSNSPRASSFGMASSIANEPSELQEEAGKISESRAKAALSPVEGELVPDFILKGPQGNSFQLKKFRGNFVLLNFWATWCPPCVEELPAMDALNTLLRTRKFSMIAVSVDDNWSNIFRFMDQLSRRPNFLILHDPNKGVATGLYGTIKFPESYLISPEGILLKKYVGSVAWMSDAVLSEIAQFIDQES